MVRVFLRLLAVVVALPAVIACGGGDSGPDARPRTPLEKLVDDYENGVISRDEFRTALGTFEDSGIPSVLTDDFLQSTLLKARAEPYEIGADLLVGDDAILVLEPGASVKLAAGVSLNVEGRFYAVGSEPAPIHFYAEAPDHYGAISLHNGPNQLVWVELDRGRQCVDVQIPLETHTLIESARFDSWSDLAINHYQAGPLRILKSRFGYDTVEADISGETMRSWYSDTVTVEQCEFNYRRGYHDVLDLQECRDGAWPVVMHNRFDGGEDDGVDLDGCSALVIGNYIHNFRPQDLSSMVTGVNGGGVTGDRVRSHPIIINNVIDSCFHGIGFKDGATPVIINNTIINSNIGVTLYQSAQGKDKPSGVMINNVLYNNVGWLNDQPQDILLNGKWWPPYNQVDDVQATLDARYNITATSPAPYEGEGNLNSDPMLEMDGEVPVPAAGSPAVDSGLGTIDISGAPDGALDYLRTDFRGTQRDLAKIDRGAVER